MTATLTHATHVKLMLISDSHLLIRSVSQRQLVHFVSVNMMLHITWWFKDVSCIYCAYALGHRPWKGHACNYWIKMTILST